MWRRSSALLAFERPWEALTVSSVLTDALNRKSPSDTGHKKNTEEKGRGIPQACMATASGTYTYKIMRKNWRAVKEGLIHST